MTPLKLFISALLVLMAAFQANAGLLGPGHGPGRDRDRSRLCPPDPTYNCPPGFIRPDDGHHGGGGFGPGHGDHGQLGMQRLDIYVGRYVQNERLYLNNYLQRNISIERVDVITRRQNNGIVNLSLLNNSRVEDSRSAYSDVVSLMPRRPIYIDGYQNSFVELEVMGMTYVDRVVIYFSTANTQPPQYPGNGYELSINVNRLFQGLNNLDIGRLVNLHQYHSYKVESVTVQGSSMQGRGQVTVLANNIPQGPTQILPTYSTNISFFVARPSQIGIDLNSLVLQLYGNITVDRVIIRVTR